MVRMRVLGILVLLASTAYAQKSPWSEGVTDDQKATSRVR